MLRKISSSRKSNSGFSLIELMVAMVLGLIVIGAVIALVLSMMRANNQTISATRLTQELRATAALMSADLRRLGGVADPLTVATSAAGNQFALITIPASPGNTCIRYSYEGAEGGNFHSIFLADGAVHMKAATTLAGADCAPAANANSRLSSAQVRITSLTFERQSPCGTANAAGRCINIILRGCLSNRERTGCDPANPVARSYSQDVYIRSIAA